ALSRMEHGLTQTLAEIDPKRQSVLFIGDMPRPEFNVPNCALQTISGLWRKPCRKYREFFTNKARPSETILKQLADGSDNVYFHDSLTPMCAGPRGCPIRVGDEIIYRDSNHLRHDLKPATRQEIATMLGLSEALSEATSNTPKHAESGTTGATSPQ